MDPFDGIATFLRVAETGSFSEAARQLELSKGGVSEQVNRLERRLGVRLFDRSSRTVRLTEVGRAYRERVAGMLELATQAEREALDLHRQPRGALRVTAPYVVAWQVIAPLLPGFLERFPEITVHLDASNRVSDLVRDQFDLAIRGATQSPEHRIVRSLGAHGISFVATPQYLKRFGVPRRPEELAAHRCATFADNPQGPRHVVLERGSERVRVPLRGAMASNSVEVLREVVLGGYGFATLPDFSVAADVAEGRLELVLPEWRYPRIELQAVYPDNRRISAKVRAFVDHLARTLTWPGERLTVAVPARKVSRGPARRVKRTPR